MRPLMPTAAASLLALIAFQLPLPAAAQTPPAAATAPSAGTAPATSATTPATPARRATRRQTLAQRFDETNTTHDGHLTKDQATAARWTYVTRNFDAMDKDHKGYVSIDDIRGYSAAQRAARKTAATPAKG